MAKKPAEDDEDDFDLGKMLMKAKQKPIAFALQVASDAKTGAVLRASHIKPADKMWRDAKKAGGTNKGTQGTLSLKGKLMELVCEEEDFPASLKKHLKRMLKDAGQNYKVKMLGPSGAELGEADEDDEEDTEDATSARRGGELDAEEEPMEPGSGGGVPSGPPSDHAPEPPSERKDPPPADPPPSGGGGGGEEEEPIQASAGGKGGAGPQVDIGALRSTLQTEYEGLEDKVTTLVEKGAKGVAGKAKQLSEMFKKQLEGDDPKKADGILGLLKKFVNTEIEKVGSAAGGAAGAAAGAVKAVAGAAAGAVGAGAQSAAGAVGGAAGAAKAGAGAVAGAAGSGAKAVAGAVGGAADNAASGVGKVAAGAAGAIGDVAGGVAKGVAAVAGAVGGKDAGAAVAGIAGGAAGAVSGTAKTVGEGAAKAAKAVADRVSKGASKIAGLVGNLGSLISKGIGALTDAVAKAANALAQRIAQGANVAAQGASAAASAAADTVGKVGDALGDAASHVGDAVGQVGDAAAGAVKAAHDAAKAAADAAQAKLAEAESTAQQAMSAAQKAAQAAANAVDQAAANAIRQLESAAKAAHERVEGLHGEAQALVDAARAEAERANAARQAAIDKATAFAGKLGAEASAVEEKISSAVAAVAGGAEHLADTLVARAKQALAEAEAKAGQAMPNTGSIGDKLMTVVNSLRGKVEGKLDEAIRVVTGIAQRLSDAAHALRDAAQGMIDDANGAADEAQKAKQEAEQHQQETLKKIGQKFAEGMQAIGQTIDEQCRKVEDARKTGHSAFDKLCHAAEGLAKGVAKAAEGLLDRAAEAASKEGHGEVQSAVDLLKRTAQEVTGGLQKLKDAATKAVQAAEAEVQKLKQEAETAIKTYTDWQAEAPTVTGPRAEELLKLAYAARTEPASTIGGIATRARAFAGELFDEAAEFVTGKQKEAESAIEATIRAIEATKLRLEEQVEAQIARLRERAEAKFEEAKTRVTNVMKEAEDSTSGLDAEHETLLQDVGQDIAGPASKAFFDIQAARKAIEDSAKGINKQNQALNDALKKLAEDGRDAIQRIVGIVKDDAVKVFEGAVDLVAKGIEIEVRSLKGQADLVKRGFEAARRAAEAEIEKLKKEGSDSLNKMKEYEKRAAGGAGKIWATIVEDLEAVLSALRTAYETVSKLNARLYKPLADLLKSMYDEAVVIHERIKKAKIEEMKQHYGTLKEAQETNAKVVQDLNAAMARCDAALATVKKKAETIAADYGAEAGVPSKDCEVKVEAARTKVREAQEMVGQNIARIAAFSTAFLAEPKFDVPSIAGFNKTLEDAAKFDLLYGLDEARAAAAEGPKAAEAEVARGDGFEAQAKADFAAFDDYQHTESTVIGGFIEAKLEAGKNGDFDALTELINRAASLQAHIAALQNEFSRRGGRVAKEMLDQRIKPWVGKMNGYLDEASQLFAKGPQKKAA